MASSHLEEEHQEGQKNIIPETGDDWKSRNSSSPINKIIVLHAAWLHDVAIFNRARNNALTFITNKICFIDK